MRLPGAPIIDADLEIEDPWGRTMTVRVRDSSGDVVLPRAALGLRTLKALPNRGDRAAWMRQVARVVPLASVRLGVTCQGRTIARLAPESRGNWLGRLLRVAPVEVSLAGIIAAVIWPRRGL